MLLSPGHSPRHLSTPAPSSQTPQTQNSNPSSNPTPNPNPKKRGPSVLDEDSYVAAIEKIIERDFFPDIPKLRDRLDWLQAVRSADPVLIRDTQLKILERRRLLSKNINNSTPATSSVIRNQSQTPGFGFSATPFGTDPVTGNVDGDVEERDQDFDSNLSLDEFFMRYTSEDNESFNKILEKVNRKRKEKYAHLLEGEKEQTLLLTNGNEKDRITDGYGTSGQPVSTLESWKYTAKNLLMYNVVDRGEVALTEEERAERLNGLTKEVCKSNTRFHGKAVEEADASKEEAVAILYSPVPGTTPAGASWPFGNREAEKGKKYDLEDLKRTPNQFFEESSKKAENGFSFVKTPSPAPGVDESPFMTWGEIDGTPLRLDFDDGLNIGSGGSSEGPHFSMPLPPSRDVKAHSLSREAARKIRERSKMFQKPPLPFSSPSRGGSASPSVRYLSPAAQKFVRNAIAKSSRSVDETLRASYRGSSPVVGTSKEKMSRLSRDGSLGLRSPAARQGSPSSW